MQLAVGRVEVFEHLVAIINIAIPQPYLCVRMRVTIVDIQAPPRLLSNNLHVSQRNTCEEQYNKGEQSCGRHHTTIKYDSSKSSNNNQI